MLRSLAVDPSKYLRRSILNVLEMKETTSASRETFQLASGPYFFQTYELFARILRAVPSLGP